MPSCIVAHSRDCLGTPCRKACPFLHLCFFASDISAILKQLQLKSSQNSYQHALGTIPLLPCKPKSPPISHEIGAWASSWYCYQVKLRMSSTALPNVIVVSIYAPGSSSMVELDIAKHSISTSNFFGTIFPVPILVLTASTFVV